MARSKGSNFSSAPPDKRSHAFGYTNDEKWLLDYLIEHKSAAGDRMSFKMVTFMGAAAHVNQIITKGGQKTSDSCKNNYRSLKIIYKLVDKIWNNSGWSWDDDKGVQVSPEKLGTWEAFIELNPGAEEFASAYVYRATQGAASQDNDIVDLETEASLGTTTQPENNSDLNSEEESDDEADPPPVTPAPLVRKRSAASIPRTSQKRTRVASDSQSLSNIHSSMCEFNTIFAESFGNKKSGLEATPCRKQRAIIRAQKLETGWLSDSQLVSLIGLLKRDITAVDSYEVLESDGLQKGWKQGGSVTVNCYEVLENDGLQKEWIRRKLEKEDDRQFL
ncbi:hypothetical protein H0H93_015796 [Arthromyces matolae]|nr:hypothetical protein H0H93_015796 [Arthromyces matolae]